FAKMDWDISTVPDPQDPATFTGSILNWDETEQEPHRFLLELNRKLLDLRRTHADLTDPRFDGVAVRHGTGEPGDEWLVVERGEAISIAVNFGAQPTEMELEAAGDVLLSTGEAVVTDTHVHLGPHSSLLVHLRDTHYPS
ncbi:MAG: DUF3459 domain-containing protein, partial [Propionibacterium sp.]|nr:DUF3459 domain-containing protein [Propionibacterium sp.]